MEIEFRRDAERRFLSVKKENEQTCFQEKMVMKNTIQGLAKMSVKHLNGESWYSYDARNRQILEDFFTGNVISGTELRKILQCLSVVMKDLERYLLRSDDLLLDPKGILWDPERGEPVFCYYPDLTQYKNKSAEMLAEFLMEHVDQKDEEAVKLAYQWFDRVCDGVSDPGELLGDTEVDRTHKSSDLSYGNSSCMDQSYLNIPNIKRREEPFYEEPVFPRETEWNYRQERDNYYLKEEENVSNNSESDKKRAEIGIIACFMLTVSAAGIYSFLLFNPGITAYFNLTDRDYVIAGICIAVFFAAAILGTVHFIDKKNQRKKVPDFLIEEDEEPAFRPDIVEREISGRIRGYSHSMDLMADSNDNNETVLLSDIRNERQMRPVLNGMINGEERNFRINRSTFMIGKMRGKADGLIESRGVSRIHACIREDRGRYYLSDLHSTNGTALNDRSLKAGETAELHHGDRITFADITMTFRLA